MLIVDGFDAAVRVGERDRELDAALLQGVTDQGGVINRDRWLTGDALSALDGRTANLRPPRQCLAAPCEELPSLPDLFACNHLPFRSASPVTRPLGGVLLWPMK